MRIVIAMDSFKGSLSSIEAGEAVREGILSFDKNAEVAVFPAADGGEGTVDAIVSVPGWETVEAVVSKVVYSSSGEKNVPPPMQSKRTGRTRKCSESTAFR